MSEISHDTMALAVIPKNELALAAQKEEAKAKKLHKMAAGFLIGALSAPLITWAGVAMMASAPVLAPIVGMLGVVLYFGGSITSVVLKNNQHKALERRAETVKTRADHLTAAASAALDAAIVDDTIRVGLDLSIVPPDETPKKVRVEDLSATINANGGKKLNVIARIFEEGGQKIDWMNESDRVSLEHSVTIFPKAIPESSGSEAPRPVVREPEKTLPACTP
jgi:hypothetical protein